MGIRIHKNIGFYLPQEMISKLLVDNYSDIMEDNEDIDNNFFKKIESKVKELYESESDSFFLFKLQFKRYLKNEKNISIYSLINVINNGYEDNGILFSTPELIGKSRYDDLIDYYEHVDNPETVIKYLRTPIYPDSFYICIEKPDITEDSLEELNLTYPKRNGKPIEIGNTVTINDLYLLSVKGEERENIDNREWTYPKEGNKKYFHPYMNPITYLIIKELKLFKEDVSYIDFIKLLEPAIVTYWS